jgi:hypothetical protein
MLTSHIRFVVVGTYESAMASRCHECQEVIHEEHQRTIYSCLGMTLVILQLIGGQDGLELKVQNNRTLILYKVYSI